MRKLSTREMRHELPHLEDVLSAEGEVVITRHGRPIARVLPMPATGAMPSHADLRARMAPTARESADLIRDDREAR